AVHVAMYAAGAPLYRDFRTPPFIPLVYGPLVPMITAKLLPLFGGGPMGALEAGRALTIASTFVTCGAIFVLARRMGSSRGAALTAMLAFALSPIVMRWGFGYRVDMPALACELAGLAAFSWSAPVALAMFVSAFFIKQGHAVGIATAVLFCWMSGARRSALILGFMWLMAVTAGTLMVTARYPDYFLNTFGAVRTTNFDFTAPVFFFGIMVGGAPGLMIFSVFALTRHRATDRLILCLAIAAAIHDTASCLRWGSNAYYFLPLLAAMAILSSAGIDLAFERTRVMRPVAQLAAGGAIALLLGVGFLFARGPDLTTNPWDPHALAKLQSIDGPILTDAAELNLVDSQPNLQWIDLMVLMSMQEIGSFDDRPLLADIRARRIAAFALDPEGLKRNFRGRPLFWPQLRSAIETNYAALPGIGPPLVLVARPR
ncbi:MAG TPA: hypothetical protein VKR29_01455, partial [Candidatus Binataceae bacterium]|nr:hypothetical protein [Candidatus Binataceae bacterium]